MACFIKLPSTDEKGVMTFTSLEYNLIIRSDKKLQESILTIKKKWLVGLHHNEAHKDRNFIPGDLFDFHIAGYGDLESKDGSSFTQIDMDCSNFCPSFFKNKIQNKDKFWDVLIVARNTRFKSLDDMLSIIRMVFDIKPVRVLAIVPHENLHKMSVGSSEIIKKYIKIFSDQERKKFTLMTPSLDYPFPFDLETLAFFYRNSKIFFHSAKEERHPRVAAYAWASGLPVVAHVQVGSLLPNDLKVPPGFWSYEDSRQAVEYIHKAINRELNSEEKDTYSNIYIAENNIISLKAKIMGIYNEKKLPISDTRWILNNLDIRLARHHTGNNTRNSLPMNIYGLIQLLQENYVIFPQIPSNDFEMELCNKNKQFCRHEDVFKINRKITYLQKFNIIKKYFK